MSQPRDLDGISKTKRFPRTRPHYVVAPVLPHPWRLKVLASRLHALPLPYVLLIILIAGTFSFGMWVEWQTKITQADPIGEIKGEQTVVILRGLQPVDPNFFTAPLKSLQAYIQQTNNQQQLVDRTVKLTQFLQSHDSPLVSEAELIAQQQHWKLILAISFAESTLGKYCFYNNCSGIGGSNIRAYKSLRNWILGFNRLLDQKYSNESLEQMCGVYVQPCSRNWLSATGQVLSELQTAGIE